MAHVVPCGRRRNCPSWTVCSRLLRVHPVVVVVASQLLFTAGDLLARAKMRQLGFHTEAFLSWWFLGYLSVRTVATFGQLWVLSQVVLSRSMAFFSAASLVLSTVLSVVVLREGLTVKTAVGVVLAILALVVLSTE